MEKNYSKEEIKEMTIGMVSAKFGVDREDITSNSNFTTDLGCDSLDLVEMVMEVEKTFGISIPDTDTQRFNTIGDVMDYLVDKLEAK